VYYLLQFTLVGLVVGAVYGVLPSRAV